MVRSDYFLEVLENPVVPARCLVGDRLCGTGLKGSWRLSVGSGVLGAGSKPARTRESKKPANLLDWGTQGAADLGDAA